LIQREKCDRTRVKKKGYQDQHIGCALLALPLTPTSGQAASGRPTAALLLQIQIVEMPSTSLDGWSQNLEDQGAGHEDAKRCLNFVFKLGRDSVRHQKHIGQPVRVHGRILRGTTLWAKSIRWSVAHPVVPPLVRRITWDGMRRT
jgi:hypothetical protein